MKTASAGMQSHLDLAVTTLTTCWRVTRVDGTAFHFTTHDVDLDVDLGDGKGTQTYKASSSYNRSAIKTDDGLSVDNLDLLGVFDDDDIKETELRAGLFDYAVVEIFVINWNNVSDGVVKMRKGWLGEVTFLYSGAFIVELRGLTQAFSRRIGEVYTAECRADLGDSRCKVPIYPDEVQRNTAYAVGDYVRASNDPSPSLTEDYDDRIYQCTTAGTTAGTQPAYDTTVGNDTTDGTAVFTAEEAWSRACQVTAVDSSEPRKKFTVTELTPNTGGPRGGFADDFMNNGAAIFETGDNAGVGMEIRDFTADDGVTIEQVIELYLDLPFDIQVGDKLRAYPGCDKRRTTCIDKFDNIVNMRAEPFIPGVDSITEYPDAK